MASGDTSVPLPAAALPRQPSQATGTLEPLCLETACTLSPQHPSVTGSETSHHPAVCPRATFDSDLPALPRTNSLTLRPLSAKSHRHRCHSPLSHSPGETPALPERRSRTPRRIPARGGSQVRSPQAMATQDGNPPWGQGQLGQEHSREADAFFQIYPCFKRLMALAFIRLTLGGDFRASASGWVLPGAAGVLLGPGPTAAERGEEGTMSVLESGVPSRPAQGYREQTPHEVGHPWMVSSPAMAMRQKPPSRRRKDGCGLIHSRDERAARNLHESLLHTLPLPLSSGS